MFACRDLDSRFTAREAAAVKEWRENSTQPIHSMRDHPHHGVGMVGASWGTDLTRKVNATNTQLSPNMHLRKARLIWKLAWRYMKKDKMIHARRNRWGPDQNLLTKYVFHFQEFI